MRGAAGFVADGLKHAGRLQGAARLEALATLHDEVKRVARAMAELHDTTASGAMVTQAVKESEAKWFFQKWDVAQILRELWKTGPTRESIKKSKFLSIFRCTTGTRATRSS